MGLEGNALSFPGLDHAGPYWRSTGIDKAMLSSPHPLLITQGLSAGDLFA